MKQLTKDQFHHQLQLCSKKGHKLRENNFGVVWCVRCGLLSTSVGNVEKLSDEQLIIRKLWKKLIQQKSLYQIDAIVSDIEDKLKE